MASGEACNRLKDSSGALQSKRRKGLRHHNIVSAVCFFLCAAVLCACEPEKTERTSASSRFGGTLYFGVETDFTGFDVLNSQSGGLLLPSMATLNNLIQEPLFRIDGAGNLVPVLGLSAVPSKNNCVWDIALRKGVMFHDGTPFDAEAVVDHWTRMLDPGNGYRGRELIQPVRKVEKIGAYAVRFTLQHPWPPFLKVISDELYLSAYIPSPTAVRAGTHDKKPVGTGPFKYGRWNATDHFILFRNEQYWQKGVPYLDKIVFRSIPDHQTRYASLLSGEIDMIALDRGTLIHKARKNPSLQTIASDGNGAEIVIINCSKSPLDDLRVRRALAMANSQKLHIDLVYGRTVPFVRHPVGPALTCTEDAYIGHDPAAARKSIAKYGKPIRIECIHTNTSRGRQTGELLQQLFKKIGVELSLTPLSTGPHVMKVLEGNYDLATWRILGSKDMSVQLYRSFHSKSRANYTGYRDPVLDKLLEALRKAPEPKRRENILCRVVRRINENAVIFYRGGRRRHIVAHRKVKGIGNVSGVSVDLSAAWIDDPGRFNPQAFEIEQKAALPFDCPDPGDIDAVKARILGRWTGADDWGGTLDLQFTEDDRVSGMRSGGYDLAGKYAICGEQLMWRAKTGAVLKLTLRESRLEGTFQKGGYGGTLTLQKTPSDSPHTRTAPQRTQ